ncbi:30S ribosomal protein S4 [Candidatus Bathyarchaeota archaeon]|nr:30S ribosomal protein S4 [Candidatus Bathyarchaeota archaeon]NIV45279.1 30S ribosomal protein S4 [Candidatus Bathyarchaeota archaeon]
MGDPKRHRKKYETPRFPWRIDVLQAELKLLGQYGLRNKRELWRHRTMLSRFRGIARSLLSMPLEQRKKLELQLLNRLHRLGILPKRAALDDVLDLSIEDILERRLQTLVFHKGLTNSVHQARQLITHRHIVIGNRKIYSPSYLVLRDEEASIAYASTSPLSNSKHPLRTSIQIAKPETAPTSEAVNRTAEKKA